MARGCLHVAQPVLGQESLKLFTSKTGSIIRHDSVWQAKSFKGCLQLANGLAGISG